MAGFKAVKKDYNFVNEEHVVLDLWDRLDTFKRSISQSKARGGTAYSFYDGPPFATGLPHYGHIVASTIKDMVARYWTMRGHFVERRFGWDTHGLPIEMETEKALGLLGPQSIRDYGIDKFNEACRAGVLRHTKDWRRVIRRVGRFVDFDNDYKTMDRSFMESVWWVFRELWNKGLVYQGFRVMPYSVRLSTPLSNFEANLNYKDVQDPSITLKVAVKGQPHTYLLVWTTTPWTLPANAAIAVGEEVVYSKVSVGEEFYIVARDLVAANIKEAHQEVATLTGKDLVGWAYEPIYCDPQVLMAADPKAQKVCVVVASSHVATDTGTGLVHIAPAYGVDDFEIGKKEHLPLFDGLNEEGKFLSTLPELAGLYFKDADKVVLQNLKDHGKIFARSTLMHSYPFCWRSDTPLIYKAVGVWFVDVPKVRDQMVKNNERVHWVPQAVGHKRFANWLKDATDWSVSRNRFWGTPIPIWQCQSCAKSICLGSAEELEKKTGTSIDDLHMHFIDQLGFACDACQGPMKRISEVFDCWFESGSMPVAQMHYPFENQAEFKASFPADFIAEGLDQTRGWFYTLQVIATALFGQEPFKNVVVNGMVLASDGSKMSKSKKNFPDPEVLLEQFGADALRAYLVGSPVVRAEPLLFNESGVKEVVRSVLLPLYHCWSFFVQYAEVDNFDPQKDLAKAPALADRAEIDRWIISKLQSLVHAVNTEMKGYYLYKTIPPMLGFIDDLTNWYIRRSRRRFWKNAATQAEIADKLAAYATLYEVLTAFAKVMAPVLPFISEAMYQNLVVEPGMAKPEEDSVHLCEYPQSDEQKIDEHLERAVEVVRQVVTLGRALREKHRIKTRQPLAQLKVVTSLKMDQDALKSHQELIESELNVKALSVLDNDEDLCTLVAKANFKSLGPKVGPKMGAVAGHIANLSRSQILALESGETLTIADIVIDQNDVLISRQAKENVVALTEGTLTVALDAVISPELLAEGVMREALSLLQKLRKDQGLAVTDRIKLDLYSESAELRDALTTHKDYLAAELLAESLNVHAGAAPKPTEELLVEDYSLHVVMVA
jgi:isoleucyl-tRNA synthetase